MFDSIKDKILSLLEELNNDKPENFICPVCGFYCLGNGGVGCIDKPSMIERGLQGEEDTSRP
jgi:hypothetical protein